MCTYELFLCTVRTSDPVGVRRQMSKSQTFFRGRKTHPLWNAFIFSLSGKNGPENFALGRKRKMELEGKCFFGGIIVSNLFVNGAKRGICTSSQLQKETMNIPSNLGRKDTDKRNELKMRKHCVVFFGTCDIIHFPDSVFLRCRVNGKAGGNFKEVATRGNCNGSVVSTFLPLPLRERSVCRRDGFQSRIRQPSEEQNEPVLLNPVPSSLFCS